MRGRYSHLGPVCVPKGKTLTNDVMRTLYLAKDEGARWHEIAEACNVSRSTLYRVMCGGNAHASTLLRIERYAIIWSVEDRARRAAYERSRRAA